MADQFIKAIDEHDRRRFGTQPVAAPTPESERQRSAANDNFKSYERSRDAGHLDWVKIARKCDSYYSGDQWENQIVDDLDRQNRPHLTINQIKSTVNAIKGEYIKSQQEITFEPRGKGATVDVAKALSFVMKQIQYSNKSRWNETTVLEDGLIEDRGYFDIRMDYSDNIFGEIREVARDPRDILLDPGAKEYDPATWKEVITTRWLTPDEIEALYGREKADPLRHRTIANRFGHDSIQFDAPTATFGDESQPYGLVPDADDDDLAVARVRVIERQHRKLTRVAYFVDPEEGDMREVPEDWDDDRVLEHSAKYDLDLLEKTEQKIRWTVSADDILLEDRWSPYSRFTVVPFFPYFRRGKPTGLVRDLLSPQDMLNKISSQELHVVNTTANSGWIFESGSLVNMDADDLERVGAKTGLVLEFNKGSTPPEKIEPNSVPTGLSNISQKAQIYFRQVSGIPETMFGQASREVSGVTVQEQNAAATTPMEVVFDNLERTRQMRAEMMLELVQTHYTETRLLQVTELDIDGHPQTQQMVVNEVEETFDPLTNDTVESRVINDLTLGEYDVIVASVPHHETMQDTTFSQAIQMREIGIMIPDWVLIENSRLPNRREISEMVKEIQGMAEPTPQEIEMQLQQQMLMLQGQEAQVRQIIADAMLKEAQAQKAMIDAEVAQQQPLLDMQKAGADMRVKMEAMQADRQKSIAELQTRIQIAQQKNETERFTAQVEGLVKRGGNALKYDVDLKKIAAQARQPKASSPSKGR